MSADYFQTIAESLSKLINAKPRSPSVDELKDTLRAAVTSLAEPEEEPTFCEHADEHYGNEDDCDLCWAHLEAWWNWAEKHPPGASGGCECQQCRHVFEALNAYSASRYISYLKQTEPQLGGCELWSRALKLATEGMSIDYDDPPP